MMKPPKLLDLSPYLRREPVTLAVLSGLAIILFLSVTGLSRIYHAQQDALAVRWSTRGVADLNARHFDAAVVEFRAALRYSRSDYSYQLSLAEALLGLKRTDEAYAYLINLWSRQPENGLVNLELARIAASRGDTEQALRFYHNAIYATWPDNQEADSKNARLELIHYLLGINAKTQAQAELIALAASVGDDTSQQAQLGRLFLRAQDYNHALEAYRLSLRLKRDNPVALAGAGEAAFNLGLYPMAQRYLQSAVAASPNDTESADRLRMTRFVLRMDPFRPQIPVARRNRMVVAAFAVAGNRLKSCATPGGATAPPAPLQNLTQQWTKLKPQITERGLRQDPDLANTAMTLVFNIEHQAEAACGAPTETDSALLLIAKLHEEN